MRQSTFHIIKQISRDKEGHCILHTDESIHKGGIPILSVLPLTAELQKIREGKKNVRTEKSNRQAHSSSWSLSDGCPLESDRTSRQKTRKDVEEQNTTTNQLDIIAI